MASHFEQRSFDRRSLAMRAEGSADRWPPFLSFCFTVGVSIGLWLSIYEMISLLR